MGFKRFTFTRDWRNAKDFKAVENDETEVRKDMQALHDEAKDGLNALMTELESSGAAFSLGAVDSTKEDRPATTVQGALDSMAEKVAEVAGINAENLGSNNIQLDKKGETALAEAYGLTDLVPNVHGALSVLSEWAKLKPETARLCGVEETATLSDAIAAQSAAVGAALGEKAQVFVGSYTGNGVQDYMVEDDEHGVWLYFPFAPKYIEVFRVVKATGATAIYEDYYLEKTLVLINPATVGTTYTNKNGGGSGSYDAGLHVRVEWGDRYVYWRTAEIYPDSGGDDPNYNKWATVQADVIGETYYYFAIG